MNRNKEKLQLGKEYSVVSDRTEQVMYENIDKMYVLIYVQMVDVGIAIFLPESKWYWIDNEGNRVQTKTPWGTL